MSTVMSESPRSDAVVVSTFEVCGGTIAQEVQQVAAGRVLVAALDVGKDVHVLRLSNGLRQTLLPAFKLPTLAEGYLSFWRKLHEALTSGAFELALIGHEPTGVYHEAWSAQLAADLAAFAASHPTPQVRYRLLHPTLVKRARQGLSPRSRKSDSLDVEAMAELLLQGLGDPVLPLPATEWRLRHLASQLNGLYKEEKRLAIHLLRTFDRFWPGALGASSAYARTHPELPALRHLVDSHPLRRERVRLLLQHAVTPHQLMQWGVAGIRSFYQAHGLVCGEATASHVLAVAQQALLPPPHVGQALACQLQADFARLCGCESQVAGLEAEMLALLPHTRAQVLTTFPGLSPLLVARYLAAMGDPSRFASPRQLWAFAGFDPLQTDSGNRRHSGAISHRGSPHLRSTLFQMGYLAALHCPDCARTYLLARQRGKTPVLATIHVANKLNRILFAMLTNQQPYRSPLSPEQEAVWSQRMKRRRSASAGSATRSP